MSFWHDHMSWLRAAANATVGAEVAHMMDRFNRAAQVGIVGRITGTFDTNRDVIDTPQRTQDVAKSFQDQLEHLIAESKLQRQNLVADKRPTAASLLVAIYALSGIREQVQEAIGEYEDILAKAEYQKSHPPTPDAAKTTPEERNAALKEARGVKHMHPLAKVEEDPLERSSPTDFLKWFREKRRSPNEQTAVDLDHVFEEFNKLAEGAITAFKEAAMNELRELGVAMDAVRAIAKWIEIEEDTFYHHELPYQDAGLPSSLVGDGGARRPPA